MRDSNQRNNELTAFLSSYCERLAPLFDVQIDLKALDELSEREMASAVAKLAESVRDQLSDHDMALALIRLRESLQLAEKVNIPPIDPRSEATPQPPSSAEYLLFLLLNKKDRDAVIGDLAECYPKVYAVSTSVERISGTARKSLVSRSHNCAVRCLKLGPWFGWGACCAD